VDVQPFLVLVAVLFGSTLFGVIGALLAVPLAASIQIVVRELLRYRKLAGEEAPDSWSPPESGAGEALQPP
jgi:predicted PurR-regulated permease PerM